MDKQTEKRFHASNDNDGIYIIDGPITYDADFVELEFLLNPTIPAKDTIVFFAPTSLRQKTTPALD